MMKYNDKKRNSGHRWLNRSGLTFCRSLMMSFFTLIISSCESKGSTGAGLNRNESEYSERTGKMYNHLTTNNNVSDIVKHPAFEGFAELLFIGLYLFPCLLL